MLVIGSKLLALRWVPRLRKPPRALVGHPSGVHVAITDTSLAPLVTGGSHEMGDIVRLGPILGLNKRFLCLLERRREAETLRGHRDLDKPDLLMESRQSGHIKQETRPGLLTRGCRQGTERCGRIDVVGVARR